MRVVYLLENKKLGECKIGRTGHLRARLCAYNKDWEVIKHYEVTDNTNCEAYILSGLKKGVLKPKEGTKEYFVCKKEDIYPIFCELYNQWSDEELVKYLKGVDEECPERSGACPRSHECKICGMNFTKPFYLKRHQARKYPCFNKKECIYCGKDYEGLTNIQKKSHNNYCRKKNEGKKRHVKDPPEDVETRLKRLEYLCEKQEKDIEELKEKI